MKKLTVTLVLALGLSGLSLGAAGQRSTDGLQKPKPKKTYELVEGKRYRLCTLFLENLRAAHSQSAPSCELRIDPKYEKYFSQPQWEELDPWQHLDWIWRMDTQTRYFYYHKQGLLELIPNYRAGQNEATTLARWIRWFKEYVNKEGFEVTLRRSHFDLDGDGTPDTVLGYRIDKPCDSTYPAEQAGDYLFTFDEAKQTVRLGIIVSTLSTRYVAILYSGRDPRDKVTQTYLLDTHGFTGSQRPDRSRIKGQGSLSLWADNNPADDYIGLMPRCSYWVWDAGKK